MAEPTGDFLARVLSGSTDAIYEGRMARVREISDGHTERGDQGGPAWRVVHAEPAVGCAWCIPGDAARTFDREVLGMVRPLDDGDWENPPHRGARLILAVLALAAESSGH